MAATSAQTERTQMFCLEKSEGATRRRKKSRAVKGEDNLKLGGFETANLTRKTAGRREGVVCGGGVGGGRATIGESRGKLRTKCNTEKCRVQLWTWGESDPTASGEI